MKVVKQNLFAFALFVCLPLSPCLAKVQQSASNYSGSSAKGWRVGVGAGVPFSLNSFSSFGPSGVRGGWTAGLSAAYSFNSLFGLEADLGLGLTGLAAQQGCLDSNYYLASDGRLYYASVLGMPSWSVKDFKSSVSYGRLGLNAYFNLLALSPKTSGRRWSLEAGPRIAAYGTKSSLVPLAGGEALPVGSESSLHFGYGGSLKAAYRLSDNFRLGLSSTLTSLTGKDFDGIPGHGHKSKLIWENSLNLSYDIVPGARKGRKGSADSIYGTLELLQPMVAAAGSLAGSSRAIRPESCCEIVLPALPKAVSLEGFAPRTPLPESRSVHFAFDKWDLSATESRKLLEILDALRADSTLKLSLEGWCDRYGSDQVNLTISRLRAESVKKWFTSRGIDPARIEATGKGKDTLESNCANARRVEVQLQRVLK